MKIYPILLLGLHQALQEALFTDAYADKVLEKTFKANKKWGSKDRAFIAESFYDIIRWKTKLEFYMNEEINPQNVYKLMATYLLLTYNSLPPFGEFKNIDTEFLKNRFSLPIENPAIKHAVPQWLYTKVAEAYPNQVDEIFEALNEQAEVYLRINTLKTSKENTINALLKEDIEAKSVANYPNAIMLTHRKNVFRTQAFQNGWFEVQDLSSQLVASALAVKEGMRVIDTCAGAGGKTLHLASLMKNKGQIIALDIHEWKLKELKRRAKRAGAHNIETRVIESSKTIKRLYNGADAILIDAPCSGLGVLKRNPDAKWKLNTDFIERVKKEQAEILNKYSKIVKENGTLVYATCSILPEENELQVQDFLAKNNNFKLENEQIILPNKTGNDGFYIAKLNRIS
ncbi:MAG: RsmB/NOP family class I SAM-dependent RNA methyltransferase [Chitinophagales bacterium]|nr:RsmB/NOP family class I SAM-dependent RNA methyltransferase [Chitinophagales bacterium]